MTKAHRWNQRVYRPITIAGNVWRIQMPPSSCRLIENFGLSASTKTSAPTLTSSDTNWATLVSWAGLALGLTNALKMLRVNRFAAAIDMIAAGTSAPIAMAAYPTPANQGGNIFWNRNGTESCAFAPCALTSAGTPGAASAM